MAGILKIILITVIIGVSPVSMLGCASESEPVVAENQVVTVQRGNLTVDITAAGNLALSHTEDLAFDIFYQEATVEEVLVEEGDIVEEGQVLARLDEDEWDEQLNELEDELSTAERQLRDAERQVPAKELALRQAQINLEEAEYNLSQIEEVKEAQDTVDDAEDNLRLIKMVLMGELGGGLQIDLPYWWQLEEQAEEDLAAAEEDLQEILDGTSLSISDDVALDVAEKQLQVEQEQMDFEDAQLDLEDAQTDVDDAQEDVDDTQEELNDANSKSPLITATFDGFITKVNVEGGDEVMTGTVAVQLADPDKFEAEIMVSEMDILQVKEGGEAWVQVDAMPGLVLPAKVTHISPTATIQSGVVNYKVKVEIQPLEEITQRQQAKGEQQGQVPTAIPENFQLREGLTVIVTILVEERSNALLVPNAAITTQGRQTYVQVLSPDGTIEERAITTGISNWQFTEVTDGLSEGEQVVVPQGTTTTTTQQGQPRGIMIPGMGPPR